MQDQANSVVVTDEDLKKRLEDHLVRRVCQGGGQEVRDWLSNEMDSDSFSAVSHRNRTTKKIDSIVPQLERSLLTLHEIID